MSSLIPSLNISIEAPNILIEHSDKLMLMGSCFSEHIGKRLSDCKFQVLENPNGILFNPLSVTHSLSQYIDNTTIDTDRLFYLNEIWHHWDFHSRFSNINKERAILQIQDAIKTAHLFLKDADWLMITLGSAFQYYLKDENYFVANCHRAPGKLFEKRLLKIDEIQEALVDVVESLKYFNPKLKIIFTISPVRHIRDGVVDNNRSKARLIETVHHLVEQFDHCYYFPAYELLIDVLRDYRFYDTDLIHPNFGATKLIWDQFHNIFFSKETQFIADQMLEIITAYNHKVQFPETDNYKNFKSKYLNKIIQLKQKYNYIDFAKEEAYFSNQNK
ncbi:MAG TPA: GSCFA domain-containing protein [Edaphocola sp.]|nr:GSCFA domain-containing protein [Edaphocola sp.]